VGAPQCIIAIERDKPQAIEAMTAAAEMLAIPELSIAELPSIYPAGGERQLVEVLTGVEVSSAHYPGEFGYVCQNVGTAYAVHDYFRTGEPLCSRIVTITGSAVAEPANVEAMIGTPLADLVAACGGYRAGTVRLIHGGSMMGFALPDDRSPITKASNCIIVADPAEVRTDQREWECIRCGECSIACPARLQPQDLLLAARAADADGLAALSLNECIECGCCDIVCPSHIPLTEIFRQAKPAHTDVS
jgi:electron transport complex protein RnfC